MKKHMLCQAFFFGLAAEVIDQQDDVHCVAERMTEASEQLRWDVDGYGTGDSC